MEDEKVKLYLDTVESYQQALETLNTHLRNGFIEIAHARQTRPIGPTNYDLKMSAGLSIKDSELEHHETRDPLLQFGAWPPSSLKIAQTEFKSAIEQLVIMSKSKIVADRLAGELQPVFHPKSDQK